MASAIRNDIGPELSRYIRATNSYPLISADEEQDLVRRWRDEGDKQAVQTLIQSHLRLVVKIAAGYRGYGVLPEELISEGNVGLVRATTRFTPDHGARFSTYATWWIRSAIQEYVLRTSSIVRMGTTSAQKKLFFNLRRVKAFVQANDGGDLQPQQVARIADLLRVPTHEVVSMNRRMAAPDSSLNVSLPKAEGSERQDWLAEGADSHETTIADQDERLARGAQLRDVMCVLNDRERHIVIERRLKDEPTKIRILASHYGVSNERIRQIEEGALSKLRQAMMGTMSSLGAARSAGRRGHRAAVVA
jgi:RNA polymerase sigma-32 factor